MAAGPFFGAARWLLSRLLLVLLIALAAMVVARQFIDGGADGGPSTASPTPTVTRPSVNDHWHATYEVFVCGQRQPNFLFWPGGVHTHNDGVIHIHPKNPSEESEGARLVKWFEYGSGKLTQTQLRMPGSREDFKNGDTCDDGSAAVLQVSVNGVKMDDWSDYIPQDGDQVRIVFGPEEDAD